MNLCARALTGMILLAGFCTYSMEFNTDNRRWYEQQQGTEASPATVASVLHDYFNLDRPTLGQVVVHQTAAPQQFALTRSHDRLVLLDERAGMARDIVLMRPPTPSQIAVGGSSLSRSKSDLPHLFE